MSCNPSSLQSGLNLYRPPVRIGNWFEDICSKEVKIDKFKRDRDHNELFVVKTRKLLDNFQKKITLDAPLAEIRIGSVIQLVPKILNLCDINTTSMNLALSICSNEKGAKNSQTINEDCEVSLAPSMYASLRNSFRIISADEKNKATEYLQYGQRFRLQCVDPIDDPILLYSSAKLCNLGQTINTTYETKKVGESNLPVGLVRLSHCGAGRPVRMADTEWFCKHIDPSKRFDFEAMNVPSNSVLVLVHFSTNKNLAAENIVTHTLFGNEYLVSVQNYCNRFRKETWKNKWMISNGQICKDAPETLEEELS